MYVSVSRKSVLLPLPLFFFVSLYSVFSLLHYPNITNKSKRSRTPKNLISQGKDVSQLENSWENLVYGHVKCRPVAFSPTTEKGMSNVDESLLALPRKGGKQRARSKEAKLGRV